MKRIFLLLNLPITLFSIVGCSDEPQVERTADDEAAIQKLRDRGNVVIDYFSEDAVLQAPIAESSDLIYRVIPAEGGEVTIEYNSYGAIAGWGSLGIRMVETEDGIVEDCFKRLIDTNIEQPQSIYDISGIWVFKPYSHLGSDFYIDCSNPQRLSVRMDENETDYDKGFLICINVGYCTKSYSTDGYPCWMGGPVFEFQKFNYILVHQAPKGSEPTPGIREAYSASLISKFPTRM